MTQIVWGGGGGGGTGKSCCSLCFSTSRIPSLVLLMVLSPCKWIMTGLKQLSLSKITAVLCLGQNLIKQTCKDQQKLMSNRIYHKHLNWYPFQPQILRSSAFDHSLCHNRAFFKNCLYIMQVLNIFLISALLVCLIITVRF